MLAVMTVRWLFADQLGPHFTADQDDDALVLLVESAAVFRRRRFHRRKAHLVLSALRHRAVELGDRAVVVRSGTYRGALDRLPALLAERGRATDGAAVSVVDPTSRAARDLVRRLAAEGRVEVLPERGWVVAPEEFAAWMASRGRRRLLLDDFYRHVRRATGLLVEQDGSPVGGRWTYDHENREPPPRRTVLLRDRVDVTEPWWPVEDEIDAGVREDLDRWERDGLATFVGEDGPRRFAVTRAEALAALEEFVTGRLDAFGPYEDAVLHGDRWMAHSLLSVPLNLGLLHPLEAARRAERAYDDGAARLASVEGFVRQVVGWCPFTAGYWAFLHRNAERFAGNHRMGQALAGLRRLDDLDAVVEQEARRDRF
jgi:deoxyribodipyrimidine photolyase-related protein